MNTSSLVDAVVEELQANGKSVKSYNLYDLNFKGCHSCFACKRQGSSSYGKCAINDDLKPILEEIRESSGVVLASPIYYRDVSGEMRSFIERLLFQNMLYSAPPRSIFGKRINVGLMYTMNITEEQFQNHPLKPHLEGMEGSIRTVLGDPRSFYAFATNQLKSYEGIEYTYIDGEERLRNHTVNFPKEIERAKEFARTLI